MSIVVTYCERVHTGILGEPLNSLSNLAYLVAAWLLFTDWRKADSRDPALPLLAAVLALTGLGSMAYHMAPSVLTLLLDVVPIFFLMLCFCWLVQSRFLDHTVHTRWASLALLLASTLFLSTLKNVANGSLMYLPAALFSITATLLLLHRADTRLFIPATALLLLGLFFRTIDNQVCAAVPFGTHFIWHLLTALSCYFAASAIGRQDWAGKQSADWQHVTDLHRE